MPSRVRSEGQLTGLKGLPDQQQQTSAHCSRLAVPPVGKVTGKRGRVGVREPGLTDTYEERGERGEESLEKRKLAVQGPSIPEKKGGGRGRI